MNEDRAYGAAQNVGGRIEEGMGRATGDVKTQLQGKAKQAEGTLHDLYGEAKEAVGNAADVVQNTVSEADDVLRTTIERRPYTTALAALGIGFLIGHFARRDAF